MPLTDRELWLLNFYRNSELHGALLMGRLARSLSGTAVLSMSPVIVPPKRTTRSCLLT